MRIAGQLEFESASVVSTAGARLYIRLLDVSRADSSALVLAEHIIDPLPLGADSSQPIPFELELPRLDPRRACTLAAHLDRKRRGARA